MNENPCTQLRHDFPIFEVSVDDQPLCYLDSAATTQKPHQVILAVNEFYQSQNANVHRGLHTLSEQATTAYEAVRGKIAQFLNVQSREIVWTSGATASLNLIAYGLSEGLNKGDVILLSPLEHHANIVPWQLAAQRTGARIELLPVDAQGILQLEQAKALIASLKPKVLSVCHASNALGNINDVAALIGCCKKLDTVTVIDGAQSLLHLRPDLQQLDCDFYVFSAHKALGPTGLGGLYGRYELLNALPVYQSGGEMIDTVSFTGTTFRPAPEKFEPGTPNIAGVIGFGAALDYLVTLEHDSLFQHEQALYRALVEQLSDIDGIRIWGDTTHNVGTVSFSYKNEHHYDLATLLNTHGIAVRSGHHCTQPLMAHLGIEGTIRVSLAFYNNHQDICRFIAALKDTISLLEE
ncbi:cysteine desulfurase [Pseudoalteromonas sp. McH1-42]|uniref:aminotransferase class V-fold PLP-dependent enzyme n=1 Tax=Pseudoalteromonas sp. McH1-42 TaxID=2917752 RepID=UPI001EF582E2|nr:cysteine desulfurase [Pseudoalteromonas sp. McH1-42]MCG7564185.1 cysteine desulfurase [Pseudoalteromonas sp. McH1-42]